MSSRSKRHTRILIVLLVLAIPGFLLLRQALDDPQTSSSAADSTRRANTLSSRSSGPSSDLASTGASVTPSQSVSAAAPTSATKPLSIPTPTPPPNNYVWLPWRSQFDGSPHASANCGPASLGMAMSYFGEWWSTNGIRKSTNAFSGVVGLDEGTDWPSLKHAAETRNFKVVGLYDSAGGYRKWAVDDLVKEIEKDRPVLLLVRQRSLPGHANSTNYGDHYIVFLGLMADGRVVYHDSAFADETEGSYRIMSQETLLKAWEDTSVGLRYTAMSLVWEQESRKWDSPSAAQPTPQTGR